MDLDSLPQKKREIIWNAEEYSKHSQQQEMVANKLLEQFSFNGNEQILDVGCGDGKITRQIARGVPNGEVTGLDSSIAMVHFARTHIIEDNVIFVLGTASNLPFENKFDVITSFSALHWDPHQQQALNSFKKALKPSGAIILAIPGPDHSLRKALEHVCNAQKWQALFEGFISPGRIWKPSEYTKLLVRAGFIIEKLEQVDRSYFFQNVQDYQNFINAMLPHMSILPKERKVDFLNDTIKYLDDIGHLTSKDCIEFKVKVLEIIAYSSPNTSSFIGKRNGICCK